eukprot:TRINITY_DN21598_c1_g2_i1.p1 TRINITY_DN21598_c1_g2~~TRINITY_DN21598_c1_g2_i1.p1  ORF type:complete len:756 (+),score=105.00 TRINITY_DN21598_c1_g2_i1:133-2400(+)
MGKKKTKWGKIALDTETTPQTILEGDELRSPALSSTVLHAQRPEQLPRMKPIKKVRFDDEVGLCAWDIKSKRRDESRKRQKSPPPEDRPSVNIPSDPNLTQTERVLQLCCDAEREADTSDSEYSEEDLDTAKNDIKVILRRDCSAPTIIPLRLHVIFVIDASKSMRQKDVLHVGTLLRGRWADEDLREWQPGGEEVEECRKLDESRLTTVFDACSKFIKMSKRKQEASVFTLITFSDAAKAWFARLDADEASDRLSEVARQVKPHGTTKFLGAMMQIKGIVNQKSSKAAFDHRVLWLSDGRPHEASAFDKVEALLRPSERTIVPPIYTVGFGTCKDDFREFLEPLARKTDGLFSIANLDRVHLLKVFTSISESITASRSSISSAHSMTAPEVDPMECPFDEDCRGLYVTRECAMVELKKTPDGKWDDIYEEVKRHHTTVRIAQRPKGRGAMRVVHVMKDLSSSSADMIAKKLIDVDHASEEEMRPFCHCSALAIRRAMQFNEELSGFTDIEMCLRYLPTFLYRYEWSEGRTSCFVAEFYIPGSFTKFNNNHGYVNRDDPNSDIMQAFSHWTYYASEGSWMIVDIQGVLQEDLHSCVLTDPQILTKQGKRFGPGDLGQKGMKAFFQSHECSAVCKRLQLNEKMDQMIQELGIETRECHICFDALITAVLLPCRHSACCQTCTLTLLSMNGQCPVCRKPIQGWEFHLAEKTYEEEERVNDNDWQEHMGDRRRRRRRERRWKKKEQTKVAAATEEAKC